MLKKKYVLIKNNYENNYSIYYDIQNNCYLKRKEHSPKSIYFFSVLFIVFLRGFTEKKIEYPFWIVLILAIVSGIILGLGFYSLDQFSKTKSLEQVDNSYEKKVEYSLLGEKLLENQLKVLIAILILFLVIAVTLYFSTTTKNFFGVMMLSFLAVYFINFSAPFEKKRIFLISSEANKKNS